MRIMKNQRQSQLISKAALLCLWSLMTVSLHAAAVGEFEGAADVGNVELPGRAEFIADNAQYRVTGSGANIWKQEDAFQFVSRKVSGDLVFRMDVEWVGEGREKHRKACAMVRQNTDADSPYVDVAVHGDGLIELQYRRAKGGITLGARTPITAPATVQLERDGDVFTVSVARKGQPFQPVGAVSLAMPDPVFAGLAVCSHNVKTSETAIFSNVTLKNRVATEGVKRVQETSLETVNVETGERKLIYRARQKFEAPNWSRDGKTLFINQVGRICTVPAEGGEPTPLDTGAATKCNNDHGLSPDGKWLAVSSGHENKLSQIYIVPSSGGAARLVTPPGLVSYWHGWSPDGRTLAYCAKRNDNFDVYTIPAEGGEEKRLTTAEGLDDGPDYTADGNFIYWNSERTGLMKIWRMKPDGSQQEQVTTDGDYADWFPHPSPDGQWLVFLSFDKSVQGHPASKDVLLRIMPLAGGKPKALATLFGGQGTINVPSWSPDSKFVAFVSYRFVQP